MSILNDLLNDLRYAARQMALAPGFTLAAVAVLAVGIGFNAAAFNLFNHLVLRTLPIHDPNSVVYLSRASRDNASNNLPYAAVPFYREHATPQVLRSVFAAAPAELVIDNSGNSEADRVRAEFVTGNYFMELGGEPLRGRLLNDLDDRYEAEPTVVLSHSFWKRRYGEDSSIVGRTVRLNNALVNVAGVAAAEFTGIRAREADAWLPMLSLPRIQQGINLEALPVRLYGRLQPHLGMEATETALRPLVAEFWTTQTQIGWNGEYLRVQPGGYAVQLGGQALWFAAMGGTLTLSILVIACLTVANMLLGRALAREREISIRLALGAGRTRLLRQLITENALLALAGAAAGLAMAWAGVNIFGSFVMEDATAWVFDSHLALFTLMMALLSTAIFGVTPAFRTSRRQYRSRRLRLILVGAQVAASCMLLIVSGLLVRGAWRALALDPGFDYRRVHVLNAGLSAHGYEPDAARLYLFTLESRLRELPGVDAVSLATTPPFGDSVIMHRTPLGTVWVKKVSADYLQTVGVQIIRGRELQRDDRNVIVVSESLARTFWPGEEALGKQYGAEKQSVIGVAHDARIIAANRVDPMIVYAPIDSADYLRAAVVIRSGAATNNALYGARAIAQELDSRLSPAAYSSEERYRQTIDASGEDAAMVACIGGLALLLAMTGIYGVVNLYVSQRTRELGIRIALGANRARVVLTVLGQLARPVIIGAILGSAGGLGASQILRRELYGLSTLDPVTYLLSISLFVVCAGAAALVPARQALKVDPMIALRHE